MTVKELIEELKFYDGDSEVIFEVDDDFEPDEIRESKYGWREVRLRSQLEPSFIGECQGNCRVELRVKDV